MKTRLILGFSGLLLLLGGLFWHFRHADETRRQALQSLSTLADSLQANDSARLLQTVVMPAALQDRTVAEQTEFLTKALRDEISAEGLAVLQRDGEFGSLTNLFPTEGSVWASQAGVRPEDCVAFKLERNGLRTEVVLARQSTLNTQPPVRGAQFRVIRCNNVVAPAVIQLSTKAQP
jgi:hypothetical protein